MVKIRLARGGAKKKPFYRIVVTDIRNKQSGRVLENVGTYDPMLEKDNIKMNSERIKYWMSVGAQATERVQKLIKKINAGAQA